MINWMLGVTTTEKQKNVMKQILGITLEVWFWTNNIWDAYQICKQISLTTGLGFKVEVANGAINLEIINLQMEFKNTMLD